MVGTDPQADGALLVAEKVFGAGLFFVFLPFHAPSMNWCNAGQSVNSLRLRQCLVSPCSIFGKAFAVMRALCLLMVRIDRSSASAGLTNFSSAAKSSLGQMAGFNM